MGESRLVDSYRLLGEDVSRSLSPAMMNAAFEATGVDARYEAISVVREEFRSRFLALKGEVQGMNLTIPFKSEVLPLLDGLDEVSARIGAANVVAKSGSRCLGYNTDVNGITAPLKDHGAERVDRALLHGRRRGGEGLLRGHEPDRVLRGHRRGPRQGEGRRTSSPR